MKTNRDKSPEPIENMRPEYDFSEGVRGKHYQAYREGHTVTIHQADGTTVIQHFEVDEGAIILEPDVRRYFPDSESVNATLRSLIALLPQSQEPA